MSKAVKKMDKILGPPPKPPKMTGDVKEQLKHEIGKKEDKGLLDYIPIPKLDHMPKLDFSKILKKDAEHTLKGSMHAQQIQKKGMKKAPEKEPGKEEAYGHMIKHAEKAKRAVEQPKEEKEEHHFSIRNLLSKPHAIPLEEPDSRHLKDQKDIKEMFIELQKKKKQLSQQEDSIISKQMDLEKLEAELKEKERWIESHKNADRAIGRLEKRKRELATELLSKELDLKRIKEIIGQETIRLDELEKQKNEKHSFVENITKSLMSDKVSLNKQKENAEREKFAMAQLKEELENKKNLIVDYEKQMKESAKNMGIKDVQLRTDILGLEDKKSKLAEEIALMRGEKNAVDAELASMSSSLKETETARDKLLKSLEKERSSLMREKESICDERHRLIEITNSLRIKEKEIAGKEAVLNGELSKLGQENIGLKKELEKQHGLKQDFFASQLKEKEKSLYEEYKSRMLALDREREELLDERRMFEEERKGRLPQPAAPQFAPNISQMSIPPSPDKAGEFAQRENELKQRESELMQKESALIEERKMFEEAMNAEKDAVHSSLAGNEVRLRETEQQIKEKEGYVDNLRQKEDALNNKEMEILEKIKIMEDTRSSLKEKEDEIINKIADLENDRALLDDKEKELMGIVAMLDKKEGRMRELEKQVHLKQINAATLKDEFEAKLARIKNAAELKENIGMLRRSIESLKNTQDGLSDDIGQLAKKRQHLVDIKDLEHEINVLRMTRDSLKSSKYKMVKELEKERDSLEKGINVLAAKSADLERMQGVEESLKAKFELMDMKEEQLEKGFAELRKEENAIADAQADAENLSDLQKKDEFMSRIMETGSKDELRIYSLLDQARSAVMSRKFGSAREIYSLIQDEYKKASLPNEQKRRLYFDVMELKTDIEINSLNAA